ncbi:MAG: hypothetical protein CMJ31_09215 [Phycisphaerae bacterium]|nr:hypothetical protein [Phycisphaerae bacterium]
MKHKNAQNTHSANSDAHRAETGTGRRVADQQAIRERAYAIHESRGEAIGSPEADWLEAEKQLKMTDLNTGISPRS